MTTPDTQDDGTQWSIELQHRADDVAFPFLEVPDRDVARGLLAGHGLSAAVVDDLIDWIGRIGDGLQRTRGLIRVGRLGDQAVFVVLTVRVSETSVPVDGLTVVSRGVNDETGPFDVHSTDYLGYGNRVVVSRTAILAGSGGVTLAIVGESTAIAVGQALTEAVVQLASTARVREVGKSGFEQP